MRGTETIVFDDRAFAIARQAGRFGEATFPLAYAGVLAGASDTLANKLMCASRQANEASDILVRRREKIPRRRS